MKAFIWFIIVLAVALGIWYLYKGTEPVPVPAAEKPVKTTAAAEKKNSEKGIQNWKAVKNVRNLNDQHNKDLLKNMQ